MHSNFYSLLADLLLYHCEAANDYPRTVRYGILAGDKAAKIYANQEAINSYERAKEALTATEEEVPADLSIVVEKIADVYHSTGEYAAALENYKSALNLWQKSKKS